MLDDGTVLFLVHYVIHLQPIRSNYDFYPRDVVSAVFATATCPSIRLSVCPSVRHNFIISTLYTHCIREKSNPLDNVR